MPVGPIAQYDLSGLMPCEQLPRPVKHARRIQPGIVNMPKGIVLAEARANANAVHNINAADATAGAFTLTFRGFTTAPIAYNATGAQIATALNLLPSIGAAGVVGTGADISTHLGTGAVLTWSSTKFTNQPIELPTLTITTTFLTAQPAITSTTTGSMKSTFGPYINGDANFGTPRGLGMYRMSTDSAGNVSFASVASGDEMLAVHLTAPIFVSGAFRIEDIPLVAPTGITGGFLDAGAATTPFLKIVEGSLADAVGVVHLV